MCCLKQAFRAHRRAAILVPSRAPLAHKGLWGHSTLARPCTAGSAVSSTSPPSKGRQARVPAQRHSFSSALRLNLRLARERTAYRGSPGRRRPRAAKSGAGHPAAPGPGPAWGPAPSRRARTGRGGHQIPARPRRGLPPARSPR